MQDTEYRVETIEFLTTYRVARAVPTPVRRPDLSFWAAIVVGVDKKYGLDQAFLPKTYPAVYQKRAQAALDFSLVEKGEIIRHKGAGSRSRDEEEFWLILEINDEGLEYRLLSTQEVAQLYQGKRPVDAKTYSEE